MGKRATKAADNASVTILPTSNNIRKILVESEDHNTRNVFEIRLGEETEETPDSGDRDYPEIADGYGSTVCCGH